MKVIDLTHVISEDMPVYPGTEGPKLQSLKSYEPDGLKVTLITMCSHTGTHIDSPAHLFPYRTPLDQFPVTHFIGKALVIDCTGLNEGERITFEHIKRCKEKADRAEYILFRLGWDKYWGTEKYFGNYPCIDDTVVDYLIQSRKKGVGLDAISIDPVSDESLTNHRKLFSNIDILIIENLTNLELVGDDLFI